MKNIIYNNKINSIDDLKKFIEFGENCGLCVPYVDLIFKTGKTEFGPIRMDMDNE